MTAYIGFHEAGNTGKTKVWEVRSLSSDYRLGTIKWYGAWRCYVLWPEPDTVWNVGCLSDVNDFITKQMEARRSKHRGGHEVLRPGSACVGCDLS